jgi:AcrR family transcriptional regulator
MQRAASPLVAQSTRPVGRSRVEARSRTSLRRPRWGSNAPADSTDARARLLDAADACFARYGVMKTTMSDVAAEAGVSRATLYRYFSDRDQLVLGVILREAGRFLERLDKTFVRQDRFEDIVVEGIAHAVDAVRADERLALLFAPEVAGLTASIAGASEALFEVTAKFLRPRLQAARELGQLRADIDLDEAVEWILRTILSLLTVRGPRQRRRAAQRSFIRTFVVPSLVVTPPATRGRGSRLDLGSAQSVAGRPNVSAHEDAGRLRTKGPASQH